MAKAKLGSGAGFKALTNKIEKEGSSPKVPKAIAASAGIKKYGEKKMASIAAKGKKK